MTLPIAEVYYSQIVSVQPEVVKRVVPVPPDDYRENMTDYDRINTIGNYVINQYPTCLVKIIFDLIIPFVS